MEKIFRIREKGSDLRKEIIGGLVTFFAMAYIIFVNPSVLSQTGMNFPCRNDRHLYCLGHWLLPYGFSRKTFPSLRLRAWPQRVFYLHRLPGMGLFWQEGLAIVLLSGIIFLINNHFAAALKDHKLHTQFPQKRNLGRYRQFHCFHRTAQCRHR